MSLHGALAAQAEGTYPAAVKCGNCDWPDTLKGWDTIDIPKGCTVEKELARRSCPHCGCRTLKLKGQW